MLFEYGNQLYDNYQKNPNGSCMDNGVKNINVIGLVVSAIPGGGLLRTVALEDVKNSVSYTVKEGFQVDKDVTDVALATVKGAVIGKISDKVIS
ncbi:hypothetical protein [Hymenobacter oligotrophus]|uniref:hypothetical protein n=1 Tax=Hymenobacter oligotrophus TaxID=2319843 RepID=UPI0013C32A07|nr:hypothetical protein [Hymenobacter oligotrophus]